MGKALRSWLYVPGDRPEMLAKAHQRGADAVIIDLEDAVAPSAKEEARRTVAAWLPSAPEGPSWWVRVNADSVEDDLDAVVCPRLEGALLAKAGGAGDVERAAGLLDALEKSRGLAVGHVRIGAVVESAKGVLAAPAIAAAPRVRHLVLGEADLTSELGLRPTPERTELTAIRVGVVLASAAAGIGAPTAPMSPDFRDLDAVRRTTQALVDLGFRARSAIHPAQVPIINEVLTPSAEEVRRARALVDGYEQAQQRGEGVFVDEQGRMVDLAFVRGAYDVLERAGAADA